jgi:hypothetical protein
MSCCFESRVDSRVDFSELIGYFVVRGKCLLLFKLLDVCHLILINCYDFN